MYLTKAFINNPLNQTPTPLLSRMCSIRADGMVSQMGYLAASGALFAPFPSRFCPWWQSRPSHILSSNSKFVQMSVGFLNTCS